jgi:hypothetical protein
LIESASLVGTNCVNALNGTGVASAGLLLELLDPPPPPPPDELPVDVDRVVPASDVVALDDVPVLVLVLESTVGLVPAVELVDNAELEFTLDVADVTPLFPADNAELDAVDDDTPLFSEDESSDVLPPPPPAPAPDDDPAVLDAVAPTVPVVVACTYISFSLCGSFWNSGSVSKIT